MNTNYSLIRALVPAAAAALALGIQIAGACTIDGKATALANGSHAETTRDKLTVATAKTYAPFTFPGHYRRAAAIRFGEDMAVLRRVLTPEAMRHSWRWEFGDGTHASGWSVTHRYARPGTYRISVDAYYPSWHQYFSFDTIRIVVAR